MSLLTRHGGHPQHLLRNDMHGNPVNRPSKIAVALLFWEVVNVDGDMNGKEHGWITTQNCKSLFIFPQNAI